VEFVRESGYASIIDYANETATEGIHLRLDREPVVDRITGYYSVDGADWVTLGSEVQSLNSPRLAIVVGASPGGFPNADLEWVEVITDEIPPMILTSQMMLSFTAVEGTTPAIQAISLSNGGGGSLNWTATADSAFPAWLSVSPSSGVGDATLTASVDTTGLAPGMYSKDITISASGAINTPQTVNVMLTVNPLGIEHYDFTYPDRASLLADGWDFLAVTPLGGIRDTEQTTGAVVSYDQVAHPGVLRIPADEGDLWNNLNDTRNTLFRDLPADWMSVRLKLSFAPTQSYQQAGLVVYVEFVRESGYASIIDYANETATEGIHLRLDREPVVDRITGYYSVDGADWFTLGSEVQSLNSPRLAIVVGASPGGFPNADIEWAEVHNTP